MGGQNLPREVEGQVLAAWGGAVTPDRRVQEASLSSGNWWDDSVDLVMSLLG